MAADSDEDERRDDNADRHPQNASEFQNTPVQEDSGYIDGWNAFYMANLQPSKHSIELVCLGNNRSRQWDIPTDLNPI